MSSIQNHFIKTNVNYEEEPNCTTVWPFYFDGLVEYLINMNAIKSSD